MILLRYLLLLLIPCVAAAQNNYDIIIRNGKIIDGTGNNWYYGDIGIKNGKITSIQKHLIATATKEIDAKGLIVAPGFIDVHTHIEGNDLRVPNAANFIYDGVTSVVTGNCGSSNTDIAKYFRQLDSVKTSINVATLVGHNDVREAIMGESQRDPSADEQKRMEELVEKAMKPKRPPPAILYTMALLPLSPVIAARHAPILVTIFIS